MWSSRDMCGLGENSWKRIDCFMFVQFARPKMRESSLPPENVCVCGGTEVYELHNNRGENDHRSLNKIGKSFIVNKTYYGPVPFDLWNIWCWFRFVDRLSALFISIFTLYSYKYEVYRETIQCQTNVLINLIYLLHFDLPPTVIVYLKWYYTDCKDTPLILFLCW